MKGMVLIIKMFLILLHLKILKMLMEEVYS